MRLTFPLIKKNNKKKLLSSNDGFDKRKLLKFFENKMNHKFRDIPSLTIMTIDEFFEHFNEVTYDEGEAFAKSHNMIFLECSGKTGVNISEIFKRSAKEIGQNISDDQKRSKIKRIFIKKRKKTNR